MKYLVILFFTGITFLSLEAKPAVEIERQELIGLPPENRNVETSFGEKQSTETRRILDEIDKINRAFGYTKRVFPISSKITNPTEGYFYPRSAYTPIFLRKENTSSSYGRSYIPYVAKQTLHETIELIPNPFQQQSYFYPAPYLQLPLSEQPRLFAPIEKFSNEFKSNQNHNADKLNTIYLKESNEFDRYKEYMSNDKSENIYRTLPQNLIESKEKHIQGTREGKAKNSNEGSSTTSLVEDILRVIASDDIEEIESVIEEASTTTPNPHLHNDKYMMEDTKYDRQAKAEALRLTSLKPTTTVNKLTNIGSKDTPAKAVAANKPFKKVNREEENESVRLPTFGFFSGDKTAQESLKEGGIVIQRLKVRKGGIAIAGPGGVATAGSGGTAIVGPGGLALTHPRGLSIAGPGAKIYSVPESTDLGQLALKSSASKTPEDGVLVATGPAVYYQP